MAEVNETVVAVEETVVEAAPVEEVGKMSNKSKGVLIGVGLGGVGLGVGGTLIAQKVAPKIAGFFADKLGKKKTKKQYAEIEEVEEIAEEAEEVEKKPVKKAPAKKK